jgi:polyvinyl alcohol dehydrogenase (cytochrome)
MPKLGVLQMRKRSAGAAAVILAVAVLAAPAAGQTPAPVARGAAIFAERCKECHDPATDRAPSRQELAAKTPEEIVAAMTTGPMTPVAEGLTPEEKQAVATFLTAR